MKILIWGCGAWATHLVKNEIIPPNCIEGFIDSYKNRNIFFNKPVYTIDEVASIANEIDLVIVAVKSYESNCEIHRAIVNSQFDGEVFFLFNEYKRESTDNIQNQNNNVLKNISEQLYKFVLDNSREEKRKKIMYTCAYDMVDNKQLVARDMPFNNTKYINDYIRYRTFELVANEIELKKVVGVVAELGVFQGTFSKLLNARFKDKQLYLYDTFESFNMDEFIEEVKNGYCDETFAAVFNGTDVNRVLNEMPYPENCIIRKGFFPESLESEDANLNFAFVSLDVDFEKSTYEGLKFFYPRLSEGGYIFIHDYNNSFLGGIKKAISKYEMDMGGVLKKVPLCDAGGTIVIVK